MKINKGTRVLAISSILLATLSLTQVAAAVNAASTLPNSVLPDRAGQTLAPHQEVNPQPMAPTVPQKSVAQNTLGAEATKIKFKLARIILEGNKVLTEAQLLPVYKAKLNSTITVAELQSIVQDITNYYRNEGYILTRAVLPPQHVANGTVKVQIIEGYIDHINVVGVPKGSKAILEKYGNKISSSRPLQIKVMEHYLLLANEIPGVQVKAVLEPSKTKQGASTLNLVTQVKTFSGNLSYDNYGTRYIGPNQLSLGMEADSIFRAGDSTQFNGAVATRPQELKFMQITHSTPLGGNGTRILFSGNQALTRPGMELAPRKIDGVSNTFSTSVTYPWLRSRTQNLTFDTGLNYIDSRVTTLPQSIPLYTDHVRSLKVGGNYDMADRWNGANSAQFHVEHGLNIMGATTINEGNTPNMTSRFGASGHFTKMNVQLSRMQQFGASRFSAFFLMSGQYALQPLLASQQFGFGGPQGGLGRGYDSAEIIGDKGLSGSIELRMNLLPGKFLLQAAQMYVFYDAGVTWNIKNIAEQNSKNSATSAGIGTRFFFTKNLSGNFMFAQPLTKQDSAMAVIGNGRQPRAYFSIVAAV
jgi:hemolysin activation/secretion protein